MGLAKIAKKGDLSIRLPQSPGGQTFDLNALHLIGDISANDQNVDFGINPEYGELHNFFLCLGADWHQDTQNGGRHKLFGQPLQCKGLFG